MIPVAFHRKARIVIGIAEHLFEYPEEALRGPSRKQPLVWYRHLVMVWLKNNSAASLEMIGSYFNRHHTTVTHADQNLRNWIDTGDELADLYCRLDELCDRFLQDEERVSQPPLNQVSISIGQAFLSGAVLDRGPVKCSCSSKVEKRLISHEVDHA